MGNTITKEVFLIINCRHLSIIKKIKELLLKYEIKLNIYKKDDEIKKLLVTDTIVVLDNELLLDYSYLKIVETLINMKRSVLIYKLEDVDFSELKQFFNIGNYEINSYTFNNYEFLIKLLMNLKTFKTLYHQKNNKLDKLYSKNPDFIKLLEYYFKEGIKDIEKLKEKLLVTTNDFNSYIQIMDELLINNMSNLDLREYLPFIYQQVYKKIKFELNLNMIINEMYYEKNYLNEVFNAITIEEFNKEYNDYLNALKNNILINNTFIKVLLKLEVIKIIDNKIKNVLSEKDINSIKQFIESKFIKKEQVSKIELNDNLYINACDDFRVRNIIDYHKLQKHHLVESIIDADIVITLVTKKALSNNLFIDNIKTSVNLGKKLLFIYIDKCEFNISTKYLIGYSDDMCYWAYKRIDQFFNKYLTVLNNISINKLKEINSNIVRLR